MDEGQPALGSTRSALRLGAYLFGAVCAERGIGAGLVLPFVNTEAMNPHLAGIGRTITPGAHCLLPLPAYSPELNPVENIWQFLRRNHFPNHVLDTYDAIVTACCDARNALIAAPETIRSIATREWARAVKAQVVWYEDPTTGSGVARISRAGWGGHPQEVVVFAIQMAPVCRLG